MTAKFARPANGSTLRLGAQIETIHSFDPADAFELSAREATGNMYRKLLAPDPSDPNNVIGDLACAWTSSMDKGEHRFKIDQTAQFVDGRPVGAKDVAYSLRRAVMLRRAPSIILSDTDDLEAAVRVEAVDELVIRTPRRIAASLLLNFLSAEVSSVVDSQVVAAKATRSDYGHAWLTENSAGSGAFRLSSWKPGEFYTLTRNRQAHNGQPARIEVHHIPDSDAQFAGLLRGDLDVARTLNKAQLDAARQEPQLKIKRGPHLGLLYIAINQRHARLRHPAIAEASKWLVDYDTIHSEILADAYVPHQTYLPSGIFGAISDRPYQYDPTRARAILRNAGLLNDVLIRLEVAQMEPVWEVAQSLKQSFGSGGIHLELQPYSYRELLPRYRDGAHEAILLMWGSDYGDPYSNTQAFIVNPRDESSRTLAWRNGWRSDSMEALAHDALVEDNLPRRRELYRQLQMRHLSESPFIFLAQRVQMLAHRSEVGGFRLGAFVNDYSGVTKTEL